MMVTGTIIPLWQTMLWIIVLAVLGVLFAFPFKRRFINEEQQPFPEGRAAGIVMDSLHHGDSRTSLLKAKLLVLFTVLAALVKLGQSASIMAYLKIKAIPEYLDEWYYKIFVEPKILGTPVTSLTLRPELDLPMIGAGGLMGIRTGGSLVLGALVNYAILAPLMIQQGDILPSAKGTIGFREITFWSLWCGVAMMTMASLVTFFAKPRIIFSAFAKLFGRTQPSSQVLSHIELPLKVSFIGIPVLGSVVVLMANAFFDVAIWHGIIAVVLVFFFCLIAINSTGLTSITPIGAMGKLTQLTFAGIAPRNKGTNLMTAGITGEVASHSANLLMDIKPGYMLGAKPRQQAIGHVLGVIAGSLLSVPIFYLVFLGLKPAQTFSTTAPEVSEVKFGEYPMPAAITWKAVADVLTEGLHSIPMSARIAALAGLILGLGLEWLRIGTRNRFPLSPVALGLGFLIPFGTCLSMFLGAFIFWLLEKRYSSPQSKVNQVIVQNQEPICAGLIAGGALMGIAVAVTELFLPAAGH
jgi:putative OPT family oligopeptide transporter